MCFNNAHKLSALLQFTQWDGVRDSFKHLETAFPGAKSRLRTGVSQFFVYVLKTYLSHFSPHLLLSLATFLTQCARHRM